MKKSLLALAVAAAGVSLVAPKFIGDNAQTQLNQFVAKINELPGYQLTVLNTKQGWFSSSSKLEFGLDLTEYDPNLADDPEVAKMMEDWKFAVEVDIQHGPVLLSKGLGLTDIKVCVPGTSDDIKHDGKKVENIYLFDGKLSLFGNLSYEDSISPMVIEFDNDAGNFMFSGYSGSTNTQNGIAGYTGQAASLEIKTPVMNMSMSDISNEFTGEIDFAKLAMGIYSDMKGSFNIGNFAVTQAAQPLVAMDDLEVFVSNDVDDNNVTDMQIAYRIAKADTPIENFTDVEIAVELNNVNQNVMTQYTEMMMSMQDPQIDEEQLLEKVKPFVVDFLTAQPDMKITNIGFTTAAGTLQSQADFKLADYEIDDAKLVDAEFWQNNVLLTSSVSLPKTMLLDLTQKNLMLQFQADPSAAQYTPEQLQELADQQAQMMADNFMQGGFLVEKDGELQLNFSVKDGMGDLNGQQIPLAALLPAE